MALEAFAFDCYYFYHLNRHADFIDHELSTYLSSPASDDVLDEVIQDCLPGTPTASPEVALAVSSGIALLDGG